MFAEGGVGIRQGKRFNLYDYLKQESINNRRVK